MKKLITGITLATALISTSAMATKARLIALGEDASGSYFIEDQRDFFLNIAHIHEHGNQVFFETGSNGNGLAVAGANSGSVDIDKNPIHEGGFVSVSGNTAYGIVLGHEINAVSERRFLAAAEAGVANSYQEQDNVIDFFYGKDNGNMKWAAGLQYSKTQDDASNMDQTVLGGRLGLIKGNMEYYANFGLTNESENGSGEFEGKHGVEIGAMKHHGDLTYYLAVQSTSFEAETGTLDPTIDTMKVKAFVGKKKKVNDKVMVFFSGGIVHDNIEVENGSGAAISGGERTDLTVPVTVGVEARVKSWLTLRGSLSQNLYGMREKGDDEETLDNSTNVNAGMGLHFGDLTIDGLIGTGSNAAGSDITDTDSEVGILSTDNLLTRLSLTYKF
jgi:hypothetical protein